MIHLVIGAVLAMLTAVTIVVVYRHDESWMYDLSVYRRGAEAILRGGNLYWRSPQPLFTYTPFAGLLLVPLAMLSIDQAAAIWNALSVLCLEVIVWQALAWTSVRSNRARLGLTAAVCLVSVWLDPISLTLLLGQVNLFLLLILLADLLQSDGSAWKGVGVGVAAGIKLIPAFFILYLALTRRFRAAAVSLGALITTVVIGFVILPGDSERYWGGAFLDSSRVSAVQDIWSQSIRSVLARWLHSTDGVEPAALALGFVVTVAGLALAIRAHQQGDEALAICACALVTLLIAPITWQHHWVWLVPMLILLADRAWRSRSVAIQGLVVLVAIEFLVRPYERGIPQDEPSAWHLGTAALIQASTYAITAVVLLAAIGLALVRDERLASPPTAA